MRPFIEQPSYLVYSHGHPQSIYPPSCSPLVSQLASISVDPILKLRDDGNSDGSLSTLNIKLDRLLSSEELSISLCESKDPSRKYYIQGTVPSIGRVPSLWLPMDTAKFSARVFCKKVAGFACKDGRVIILDLTQLRRSSRSA